MKVTLITLQDDLNCYGLRCLTSVLKESGVQTQLLMLDRWGAAQSALAYKGSEQQYPDKTLEDVRKLCEGSDLIGFSVMTLYFKETVRFTQYLKTTLNVPVMWGGIHPICEPKDCLQYADIVCLGEAEETIIDVVNALSLHKGLKGIPGIMYKEGDRIITNPTRQPSYELDKFPYPHVELDNTYVYNLDEQSIKPLDRNELLKRWGHVYMTINARGCPMRCTYCCNSQLSRRFDWTFVRSKSITKIIGELKHVKNIYPELRGVKLSDDAFGDLPVEYIKEFASEYKKEISLPLWVPGFSPSNLTREKLSPLVDAGLVYTRIGIQSGSPRVRKLYGRHDTNEQIINAVKLVHEFRPKIKLLKLDIITDNPWETEDDIIESIRLLMKLPKPYMLCHFKLTMFPGTPLYIKAKREGILRESYDAGYSTHFYNIDMSSKLNKIITLFTEPVVLNDKIEGLISAHKDENTFEQKYTEYINSLSQTAEVSVN